MSKKEVVCNLTDSDLNNLNTAIECIKVNQKLLLKDTIEQTNAIAVTVCNIYEIVSNDRGSMIRLSKETGINKGTVSKMYTAVTLMVNNDIPFDVSYNKVYKVKDVIENNPTRIDEIKSDLINLSVNEILSKYAMLEDKASGGTDEASSDTDVASGGTDKASSDTDVASGDTNVSDTENKFDRQRVIDDIKYILSSYCITIEDNIALNKLLACLK